MTLTNRWVAAVAAAAAVAALLAGCDLLDEIASADEPTTVTDIDLADAIDSLTIADEHRDGYDRDLFADWVSTGDGCDTRDAVLLEEDLSGTLSADDCGAAMDGEWYSVYDDTTVYSSSDLDIDHVVPLAEAWDSGAHAWTADERADYATWLDDPDHLIAVTAGSNRSKGDADPAEWMPPYEGMWCEYITTWVAIKVDWGLAVDQAEYDAIIDYATTCND